MKLPLSCLGEEVGASQTNRNKGKPTFARSRCWHDAESRSSASALIMVCETTQSGTSEWIFVHHSRPRRFLPRNKDAPRLTGSSVRLQSLSARGHAASDDPRRRLSGSGTRGWGVVRLRRQPSRRCRDSSPGPLAHDAWDTIKPSSGRTRTDRSTASPARSRCVDRSSVPAPRATWRASAPKLSSTVITSSAPRRS